MKRKLLVLTIILAMCVTTIAGCGKKATKEEAKDTTVETKQETTTEKKEEPAVVEVDKSLYEVTAPITIKWWHALEDQYAATIEKVVADFNASQEFITVEAEYIGSYSDINETLVAAHAAGTGLPGVVVANTPYVAEYGASGLTEDLTPYIAASEMDINDFGLGLVNASSYQGKQVSLPFLISTQVMYYNKEMATELGVTVPTKFDDMEEFLKTVSKFNADGTTSVYGTIIPGWDQWYFETFYLNKGVKIINEDGVTTDLDSEVAIEVAKELKTWCDNGTAYLASGTDASSIMRQHFIDKEAFSVLHTSSLYNTYDNLCDFEVGMAWLPGDQTFNSEIGGCVLLIPSKNDQATKNAAWQFMQYLTSEETNMIWATETGYMPTRKSVLETDEAKKFVAEKPAFQVIFDNLDLINPRIQNAAWSQLVTIWKSYMAETIIENLDVEEQMKLMAEEINELLGDQ